MHQLREGLPESVAILGAGYMGTGIAQALAPAGVRIVLADATPERTEAGVARAISEAHRQVEEGLLAPEHAAAVAAQVAGAASIADAVAAADLVIEATTENPVVKHEVLAAAEAAAPPHAVISTNTSAIPIAQLSAPLQRPERFLGVHWFNPPQLVPCVEVIPGPATEPAVVDWALDVLRAAGKVPVAVGDGPGFVGNRIQFAMFREAAAVVADGVASAEAVDEVVRSSFGYRLPFVGPFAVADMAGLDIYAGAYASLEAGLGADHGAPPAVTELVAQGKLGSKTGGGFLDLTPEEAEAMRARRDAGYAGLARLLSELDAPRGGAAS
jgi:3-hydroxybutyryl-CoA dehydrogenase